MNKWCCSKSTQRDLQKIRLGAQEECSMQFIPTHAHTSDFRLTPEVICDPPSFFTLIGIPYEKTGIHPCFGIDQEKFLWAH